MTTETTTKRPANTKQYREALDAESRAEKAWQAKGCEGDKPPTPLLDEVRGTYGPPPRTTNGNGRRELPVRFTRNGRLVPEGQNVMSRMAFYFSASINNGERMSVDELRKRLAGLGVDDPEHTEWDVEMCPGVRWGAIARTNDTAITAASSAPRVRNTNGTSKSTTSKPPAKPAKVTAAEATKRSTARAASKRTTKSTTTKKPAAKRTTSSKSSTTKSATSKSTTTKATTKATAKQVTPNFKK